ncbi:hypothetical protein WJX79_003966 [Trebouxia sp. C0005]
MTGIPSESRQPTEFQKMRLQLSGLVVRPASLKPALRLPRESAMYPLGCTALVNCSEAKEQSRELTELRLSRLYLKLCRMLLGERAELEQVQSALQSTATGYTVAVRKGAHLQQILNELQPKFVGLRRERDRAEQRVADLASQVVQKSRRVEELEGHQERLSGRVLLLERQKTTLEKESAGLKEMLDASSLEQQEEAAAREQLRLENEVAPQMDGLHSKLKEAQHSKEAAVKAHKSELLRATRQVAEKQSVFEGKQAESSKLGDCLTANVEEVAALRQGMAGAAQVRSAAAQESKIAALDFGLMKEQEDKADAVKARLESEHKANEAVLADEQKGKEEAQAALAQQILANQELQAALTASQEERQAAVANEAVDEDLQHLHEEKHSEGEDKQAETVNLGHRLTASIEQVSTVHRASAQDSHTNEIQNPELEVYGPYMDRYRAGFFDEMPRLPAPTPTAQLRVLIPFDTLPSQIGFVIPGWGNVSACNCDDMLQFLPDSGHMTDGFNQRGTLLHALPPALPWQAVQRATPSNPGCGASSLRRMREEPLPFRGLSSLRLLRQNSAEEGDMPGP